MVLYFSLVSLFGLNFRLKWAFVNSLIQALFVKQYRLGVAERSFDATSCRRPAPAIEGTITKKPNNNNNNNKNGIARVLWGKHGGGAVSSDGAVHSTLLPKENGATVHVNCDQD